MKLRLFLIILLASSILVELLLIAFPLIFLLTYIVFSITSKFRYLIPAAILSLVGDSILGYPIGVTLIFVCLLQLSIYLYSRYLGSKDALVYLLSGIIGIFIYAIVFTYSITSLFKWFIIVILIWMIYKIISGRRSSV